MSTVAVVTGAASGIGRATALRLARDGYEIAMMDLDAAGLTETRAQIQDSGGRAHQFPVDLSGPLGVGSVTREIAVTVGAPEVLVNVAGIGLAATVLETSDEDWNRVLEWIRALAPYDLWWVEEPTSPDDVLGHASVRRAVAPIRIATGEHVHNRVMFKQLLQARAIDVLQPDAVRVGGVNVHGVADKGVRDGRQRGRPRDVVRLRGSRWCRTPASRLGAGVVAGPTSVQQGCYQIL